ncbi:hypothetical protein MKY34_15080 [Sporosarcina sp. FSL K6-1522]|uniref:hypothetical protein n=1 Tax=Sporosarcina sp. FSL K6-1522 TaxID=2921554 RepID=UPI00315ABBAF
MFFRNKNNDREIDEFEVVEVNKSSADAVSADKLVKYNKDTKEHSCLRRRLEQRTHNVKGDGFGDTYILWLSKESFEANVRYNKDLGDARKKAHKIVDSLTLGGLENLINRFE